MGSKTIYVDCPCCGTRIEADSEHGKVVQHWEKTKSASGDSLKDALDRMKQEKEKRNQYFASAKDVLEEQKKKTREKFEKEKERVRKEGDSAPPPRPFDWD